MGVRPPPGYSNHDYIVDVDFVKVLCICRYAPLIHTLRYQVFECHRHFSLSELSFHISNCGKM